MVLKASNEQSVLRWFKVPMFFDLYKLHLHGLVLAHRLLGDFFLQDDC